MYTQDLSMVVHAEAGPLCEFMSNPENERLWNPDMIEIRRLDDGPVAAGAGWEARYKFVDLDRIRLEAYDPPSRLAIAAAGERMNMSFVFTFTPAADGTRVDAHCEMHPKGMMRLIAPLMMPMIKRQFAKRPAQLQRGLAAARSVTPAASHRPNPLGV
jgi:hypothetical protein